MKVADFIRKYSLDDLIKLASEECNSDISNFLFFILDDNKQVKKEYKKFYNMLKELEPDKDIKGRITVDPFLSEITGTKNSKNERLEFLSWEEVLALEINCEDRSYLELLQIADGLLFFMTMHERAFDRETKHRIEYEEKVKQSLVPQITSAREKFLYFLRNILDFSVLLLIPLVFTFLIITAAYKKFFAVLIETDLHSLLIKAAIILVFLLSFTILKILSVKLDSYLDREFKRKFRQNIEQYLKEHPEASSFLNAKRIESFDYVLELE